MILTVILLASLLTLDTLGVALSYGMKEIEIPLSAKIITILLSVASCGLSIFLGNYFHYMIPAGIANWIGLILLGFIGFSIIVQGILSNSSNNNKNEKTLLNMVVKPLGITIRIIQNPLVYDVDHSKRIEKGEAMALGLALSVDSTGVGFASAMTGCTYVLMPIFLGVFQLIFLYLGLYLGKKLNKSNLINKKLISVLPGLLILIIALMRMI